MRHAAHTCVERACSLEQHLWRMCVEGQCGWVMWYMQMSHVTRGWVMSHMNGLCHVRMSHGTHTDVEKACPLAQRYVWARESVIKLCHIWSSCVTFEQLVSHLIKLCPIWTNCVKFEQVVSHLNKLCPIWTTCVTFKWVMRNIRMPMDDSSIVQVLKMCACERERQLEMCACKRERELSCHIWMSHGTHTNVEKVLKMCVCER